MVPNLEVEIKCKASGEIVKLPFDVSAPVKKGDLLVQLDPVDEERSVRRAEVSLAVSKARLVPPRNSQSAQQLLPRPSYPRWITPPRLENTPRSLSAPMGLR